MIAGLITGAVYADSTDAYWEEAKAESHRAWDATVGASTQAWDAAKQEAHAVQKKLAE